MSMPSYNALRAFEAVARLGNVGAAAEELHVTQSAISHLLRQLESSLEMRLLQRKGRKVQPTANGERLATGLLEGFARVHAAVDSVAHPVRSKRLTVACLPSVAARWMVPKLSDFRQAHPNIQLHIHYSSTASAMNADLGADLVITWLDSDYHGSGRAWRLFDGATYPVCSPLYLDRFGKIREPADLLRAELLHDVTTANWRAWFRTHGLSAPEHENEPVYEDFNLMSIAVLAGHGVALSPLALLKPELQQGMLLRLFEAPANIQRSYWIITPAERRPEADAFVEWALAQAAVG
ncbi:MAG: LysR family transcriptional regulator [Gammaproteobacteria bacterium]|nr:LysR family transcriptional regulator [Gammaproteobacteria bacterium]